MDRLQLFAARLVGQRAADSGKVTDLLLRFVMTTGPPNWDRTSQDDIPVFCRGCEALQHASDDVRLLVSRATTTQSSIKVRGLQW